MEKVTDQFTQTNIHRRSLKYGKIRYKAPDNHCEDTNDLSQLPVIRKGYTCKTPNERNRTSKVVINEFPHAVYLGDLTTMRE